MIAQNLSNALTQAGISGVTINNDLTITLPVNITAQNAAIATQIYIDVVPAELRKSSAAILRKSNSKTEARLSTQLKILTPQRAVDYIETNVKDLASAKAVIKIMARMLIAMRDEVWPELPEE